MRLKFWSPYRHFCFPIESEFKVLPIITAQKGLPVKGGSELMTSALSASRLAPGRRSWLSAAESSTYPTKTMKARGLSRRISRFNLNLRALGTAVINSLLHLSLDPGEPVECSSNPSDRCAEFCRVWNASIRELCIDTTFLEYRQPASIPKSIDTKRYGDNQLNLIDHTEQDFYETLLH